MHNRITSTAKGKADAMTQTLATFRRPEAAGWGDAWVGMEPTFQTKKSIRLWNEYSAKEGGEDAYFEHRYMLGKCRRVADAIKDEYRAQRRRGKHPGCMFANVDRHEDLDQWEVRRQNLVFHWPGDRFEPLEVRLGLDPETFEYSIKPVPLVWFYDPRFVAFLEEFLWRVPLREGLSVSIAHGGAQFSLSAKTFLRGSLLADDIAYKLNHPELSTLIMDWPNPDDRAFRATRPRFRAFRNILAHYWAGGFHPRAIGTLTAENAYLDRGFGPAASPPPGCMSDHGPLGTDTEVFQTNFAFGRAVRLQAQNVHPGYWQSAHHLEEGYRPDQIMRYSEGNLNRLQIAGEFHVKSGTVLDPERVPELQAPLEPGLLTIECSWENRAQMGRTSARDFVEAVLLDVHHAQYLQAHPRVPVKDTILQDQLLGDAEATLERRGAGALLARLRRKARKLNAEASRGRLKSDWIEPETLFWAAWSVLAPGERAAIAREGVAGFTERVAQAAMYDTRPEFKSDPMEWHRHRIHPLLWKALDHADAGLAPDDPVRRELAAWQAKRELYSERRPPFSQAGEKAPWKQAATSNK